MRIGETFNPRNAFVGLFIPEALAASPAISSTAKLAYGHLVRRAGENGCCWPSAADVAKYTGVGERAAQRALRELQASDLIRATVRSDKNGRQTTNAYAFIWSPILEGSSPVKNDTLPLSKTTPSGVSEMTGTTLSKMTPEKCQKKSVTGKESDEDEGTSTPPAELTEMLPDWLDADAQCRIWGGCRRFAGDCTAEEVAAALQVKIRQLGRQTTTGLVITSVPKMFEGPRGFHHGFRQRAAELERQRQELRALETVTAAEQTEGVAAVDQDDPIPGDANAPMPAAAEFCRRCGGDGVVNGTMPASWCDCDRGRQKRRAQPHYVDVLNRSAWRPVAIGAPTQLRPPQSERGSLAIAQRSAAVGGSG